MWIARDKNGTLHLSIDTIQYRDEKLGEWCYNIKGHMKLPKDLFPELTWEDEPEEIVITLKNPAIKGMCNKCGKEFKYRREDIKEWNDTQPSSGYDFGAEYVTCPHCGGYNELGSW